MVANMRTHESFADRKQRVLELLDVHGVCSAAAMARAMETGTSNTRHVLLEMVADGTIERHPMAQQCYRIKKNTPPG